tara:strand:+ start:4654 stop:4908 length:255 start_codon:yes stop_codon:yes gene_type:complete
MKILKIIFWPLIMLKNILDPNYWAEKIFRRSGLEKKAKESKIRKWANSLTGWKWWAWQIVGGGIALVIIEIGLNYIGMTMLPWR